MSGPDVTKSVFAVAVMAALSACSSSETSRCESDADCLLAGTRCDLTLQQCVCSTDDACAAGQFCNRAGVCQERAACSSNADCPDGAFCDLVSGGCIVGEPLTLENRCGLSTHCGLGSVCIDGQCAPGCFDTGDCPVGEICDQGQCLGGFGICDVNGDCALGESCDRFEQQCVADRRGPYCRLCTRRDLANPEPCGDPLNFCLVNNREFGGLTNFCGVDCSLGQPCPNGYGCANVIILTDDQCTSTAQCQCNGSLSFARATCGLATRCDPRLPDGRPDPAQPPCVVENAPACNGGAPAGLARCFVPAGQTEGSCECATNADCADGAMCAAGLCCGGTVRADVECVGGEGAVTGFCTCSTDNDCPNNSCDSSRGVCALTGLPCVPGNGDCKPIPCVNNGCIIGQNCAPSQGRACSDVRGP